MKVNLCNKERGCSIAVYSRRLYTSILLHTQKGTRWADI